MVAELAIKISFIILTILTIFDTFWVSFPFVPAAPHAFIINQEISMMERFFMIFSFYLESVEIANSLQTETMIAAMEARMVNIVDDLG